MKDYKRLTVKMADGEPTVRSNITIQVLINHLAELEDKIENGTLVPRYSILQDLEFGWWCVCEVDEQSRIIAQCKTEEEAKRKMEELINNEK